AVGTINFMAPEVLRGEGATPASDVFSAGCLAQYMITGYEPYYGEEIDEIREALLAGTPLHPAEEVDLYLEALFPREVSPESRRALVDLIRDATDPDPTARPLAAALLRRLDTLRIARPRALSVRRGEEVEPSPTRAFFATGI
ncbi:MAG TPA: protein kinase, partial [Myxococcota bacterium]|nr:protein kinase [Myxococcota bacterium]